MTWQPSSIAGANRTAAFVPVGRHVAQPPLKFPKAITLLFDPAGAAPGAAPATAGRPSLLVLNADGRVYVRNLAGPGNLAVNEAALRGATLRPNDTVRVGEVVFRFDCDETAQPIQPVRSHGLLKPEDGSGRAPVPVLHPVMLIGHGAGVDLEIGGAGSADAVVVLIGLGGQRFILDLTGAGVSVDGQPVHSGELAAGCTIRIGRRQFTYATQFPSRPDRADPPPAASQQMREVSEQPPPRAAEVPDAAAGGPAVEYDALSSEALLPLVKNWGPLAKVVVLPAAMLDPGGGEPARPAPRWRRWWVFATALAILCLTLAAVWWTRAGSGL